MRIPTTIVGSYPVDGLAPEVAIRRAVTDQIEAGVDVLADGQVRADMIAEYAVALPGLAPDPPRVVARVRPAPSAVRAPDFLLANHLAGGRLVKGVVTGPTTLAYSLALTPEAPYHGRDDPRLLADLEAAIAAEIAALRAAGASIIQIDEPVLSLGGGLWPAAAALRRLFAAVQTPVLHVCGDTRDAFRCLAGAGAAVLDIEGSRIESWPPIGAADLRSAGLTLALGCIDTRTDAVETVPAIAAWIALASARFGAENLWLSPDCGFRLRSRAAARAKMRRMVAARDILVDD
jgi:5-methyltetrahydropteroyltriglutamate--homocysteine methyltransferase